MALEQYGKRRALAGLLDYLTLVAFRARPSDTPLSPVVPVVPLFEWSWLDDSIPQVVVSSRKDVL